MTTIHELEHKGHARPEDVDAFLEGKSFPYAEGTTVTFVFRGHADEVLLRHWITGLPSTQPFTRLPDTDFWFLLMELPERSRVEYKLELREGQNRRLILDPLNPNLAHDPYGSNSVVHATGYEIPDWTLPDPEARPGEIESYVISSDVLHERRQFQVYTPARFRMTRRYPLLIVLDGSDFLRYSGFKTVLDNLIHRLEIPPMVVALLDSARRLEEFAGDERHSEYLARELVPLLEERYPTPGTPSARGILGASFGGVAGLSAAWRHPGVFGNLFLLSGSFAFTDIGEHDAGPAFDPVVEFVNGFRENPGKPVDRLFMTCGQYEPMIYYNRSMVPLLQSTGMDMRYVESRDGHNWENWRDRLREGLSWLFPGPLWMVYE